MEYPYHSPHILPFLSRQKHSFHLCGYEFVNESIQSSADAVTRPNVDPNTFDSLLSTRDDLAEIISTRIHHGHSTRDRAEPNQRWSSRECELSLTTKRDALDRSLSAEISI